MIISYKTSEYIDCSEEQSFKTSFCKRELSHKYSKVMCIETEETIAGFPDVMCLTRIDGGNRVDFFEFKYSDRRGKIVFQPTQPAFYKRNPELNVRVVAYDTKTKSVHIFPVSCLFEEGKYKLNNKAEVQL